MDCRCKLDFVIGACFQANSVAILQIDSVVRNREDLRLCEHYATN